MFTSLELTGRARTHITQVDDPRCALHHDVVQPFLALLAEAAKAGIDLRPYSSFRDFDTQVLIWNRKFRGERLLYDAQGGVLDNNMLTDEQKVDAILLWSALPGTSRHHWGTEIDVIDQAAMPEGYRVRLLPEEYAEDGVFHALTKWLDANVHRFGFYHPYDMARGGVAPEPWHLSYAPVSSRAQSALTTEMIVEALRTSELLGVDLVCPRLSGIFQQYVTNVANPSPTILAAGASDHSA